MTAILNDRTSFRADFLDGFVSAHSDIVERIPETSAVIRRGGGRPGQVSVVVGGGSGHFPAFCGFVGEGLATAAVVGEVFTSPSAQQVERTITAADRGGGTVLCIGNYSGDVMNFGMAQRSALQAGLDVRTVVFSDDIASAPADRPDDRRGVAGGLYAARSMGAAAAKGLPIEAVEEIGLRVVERTRTFGVAFSGCTLPGESTPLFEVDPGTTEIGLGIHGEPGVGRRDALDARELADLLVDRLIEDRPPARGEACAVLVNGMGGTGLEELYILFREVDRRLHEHGVEPEMVDVGQFVTSLDMAGCSVSLCWLDEDLRTLLSAPARTAGFTRGAGS